MYEGAEWEYYQVIFVQVSFASENIAMMMYFPFEFTFWTLIYNFDPALNPLWVLWFSLVFNIIELI